MVERPSRCNDEFWGTHCDRPVGHTSVHRSAREGRAIAWLDRLGHVPERQPPEEPRRSA